MRSGCVLVVAGFVAILGLGGGLLWVGSRLSQEPDVVVAQGTPDDGIQAQQKIFALLRGETRSRSRAHQVVLTEAELNRFLTKHLVEVARMPIAVQAVRLAGDGVVEFKGRVAVRDLLSGSTLMPLASLVPTAWLERQVWLHLGARASLEVGATRTRRCYLRFEVHRFAIGRQVLPGILLHLLPSPGLQGLLRWRMPDSVDGLTIDPGVVAIRISS